MTLGWKWSSFFFFFEGKNVGTYSPTRSLVFSDEKNILLQNII
ncbi:hypothetical protein FEM08_12890 [Flavobacterium gilvum]|nr:hypothetical protein FEM08_12890 [Flavobacterium gilvum]